MIVETHYSLCTEGNLSSLELTLTTNSGGLACNVLNCERTCTNSASELSGMFEKSEKGEEKQINLLLYAFY